MTDTVTVNVWVLVAAAIAIFVSAREMGWADGLSKGSKRESDLLERIFSTEQACSEKTQRIFEQDLGLVLDQGRQLRDCSGSLERCDSALMRCQDARRPAIDALMTDVADLEVTLENCQMALHELAQRGKQGTGAGGDADPRTQQ